MVPNDTTSDCGLRILLLGINYDPEIIAIAVYSSGLTEYLSQKGAKIDVVTALPYYPAWHVFDGWNKYLYRNRRSDNGTAITHCPLYVPARPTGAKRMVHHLSFALTALPVTLWKAITKRPDVVMVVAPSILSGPAGWLAARLGGSKAWLHIQDYEVEAAFATGLLKEHSRVGRFAKRFEAWILRRFDKISTISKPMLQKLLDKNIPKDRIYELRNWANLSKVSVVEGVSPMKAKLGIKTRYVALYSGNLANKQGLEILPEMAKKLAERDDLTIVVCGDGPMREKLEKMAAGLNNIRFLPLQPLEQLSDLLGMADVHLLPQIAGAADLVLPSKLTNMLASGRPVLATALPDTALYEEVDGAGLLVAPDDGAAAAEALLTMLDDEELRRALGAKARERALERWDMASILNGLEKELANLCGRPLPASSTPQIERPAQ